MTVKNEEALASPIYNPKYDERTVDIYKLMNTYPDELIEQYRTVFENLPTVNPYSGVIENPRGCEISTVTTDINEVISKLEYQYQIIQNNGTPVYDPNGVPVYTPTVDDVELLQEWDNNMPSIRNDMNTSLSTMSTFQTHTDRLISNLPSLLGIAQNSLGIATILMDLANPCAGLLDFLGSILEQGKRLLKMLQDKIQQVLNYINNIVNFIKGIIQNIMNLISKVMQIINNIIDMILTEIMNFVKALIDLARMGLASLLNLLPDDPCLRTIIGIVGTGALIKVMS